MLHPEVDAIVRAARVTGPSAPVADVATRRRQYRELALALWPQPSMVAEVRKLSLPVSGGLPARLYVPVSEQHRALLVYFHGGAFVLGDLDTHDALCRRLADDTGMRLLSVGYRLAPEAPFPAAVDDAVAAVRHVCAERATYGEPDARVIVIGDSSGGTLAAVAAAATRGEGLPIAAQALIYPTLGPELLTSSAHEFGVGYLLDVDDIRRDYELYLGGFSDHSDPRVSPLMSFDLTGAPPAVVVVAECDPLRDEGVAYAGLLEHFAVPVELLEAEGMIHGFLRLGGIVPDALSVLDDLARHLQRFVEGAG